MLNAGGLLGAVCASSSSPTSLPVPPLLAGLPAGDSPLLRSLSPVLTPSQPSPAKGPDISLSSVKVSLEAIIPSESTLDFLLNYIIYFNLFK